MEHVSQFMPYIASAVGGGIAAGAFKGPIQTLEDWWYINFGHNTSEKAEMLKAERQIKVEALKKSTLDYATQIDPSNVQEPKLNIIGPALEASKYYIDEDDLREMFARIVSSSMDSSKNDTVHPSFIEIIKQLTPLDASNLRIIYESKNLPIAQYKVDIVNGSGGAALYKLVFLENQEQQNIEIQASSISNLSRLGVIEYNFTEYLIDDSKYSHLLENELTKMHTKDVEIHFKGEREFNVQKGLVRITPYGSSFCSICL